MRRSGSPGIIGSTGADRPGLGSGFLVHAEHQRLFRGSRYNPTTSRTLSMNCGSLLILKVSTRCGLSPNAFQIRPTVDFDSPILWPSTLATMRRSGLALQRGHHHPLDLLVAIARGARARSSANPFNRSATNRPRHLHTICCDTPNSRQLPCWICLPHNPTRSDTAAPAPAPTSPPRPPLHVSRSSRSTPPPSPASPSPPTKSTITH